MKTVTLYEVYPKRALQLNFETLPLMDRCPTRRKAIASARHTGAGADTDPPAVDQGSGGARDYLRSQAAAAGQRRAGQNNQKATDGKTKGEQ